MTRRVGWLAPLSRRVKVAGGVVGGIAAMVAAAYGLDSHWAKAVELAQLAGQVERGQLKSDYRALRQEETALQSIPERERRALTSWERQRLQEIQQQKQEIERDLRRIERK